jgi:hypothetical protein
VICEKEELDLYGYWLYGACGNNSIIGAEGAER